MAYGPGLRNGGQGRRRYVDRILRGPGRPDLPVEQPMKFELVINLQTAQKLGLVNSAVGAVQADKIVR